MWGVYKIVTLVNKNHMRQVQNSAERRENKINYKYNYKKTNKKHKMRFMTNKA